MIIIQPNPNPTEPQPKMYPVVFLLVLTCVRMFSCVLLLSLVYEVKANSAYPSNPLNNKSIY